MKGKIIVWIAVIFIILGYFIYQSLDEKSNSLELKKVENKEDFLFGLGGTNVMIKFIKIEDKQDKDMEVSFYIENNTEKKVNVKVSFYNVKNLKGEWDLLENYNENEFEVNRKSSLPAEITFKLPRNIDYEKLRVKMEANDEDGKTVQNISGQFYYFKET